MSENKQPLPFDGFRFRITPWDIAKGVGGAALEFFKMHQLSTVSDHDFGHGGGPALDRALYDNETDALNNMNQIYFPDEVTDGKV